MDVQCSHNKHFTMCALTYEVSVESLIYQKLTGLPVIKTAWWCEKSTSPPVKTSASVKPTPWGTSHKIL